MAQDDKGLVITPGDMVEVSAQGIKVVGRVTMVQYWVGDGWDLEIAEANVPGRYSRWKQWQDGGSVRKVGE